MYNPKIKDFLEQKPNLTVIGLYWAGYWRLFLAIFGVYLAFVIIALITAMFMSS